MKNHDPHCTCPDCLQRLLDDEHRAYWNILGWSIEDAHKRSHLILDVDGRARAACGISRFGGSVQRIPQPGAACHRCRHTKPGASYHAWELS